jgi:glycosyltransferase involved in cell wall biosynthesis
MDKLVSIIITTYNSESYIEKAIRSALEQNYKNIEIIICDDGSTDSTESIVNKIINQTKSSIKFYKLEHFGSPAMTRNKGLTEAKGEYIAFLDGDDVMMKNRIKKEAEFLEKNLAVDILCTNAKIFESNLNQTKLYLEDSTDHKISFKDLAENNTIIHSTVMLRKNAVEKIGLCYTKVKFVHEDYEYYLRAAADGLNIYYLSEPLIFYKINPTGISSTAKKQNYHQKTVNTFKALQETSKPTPKAKIIIEKMISKYTKLAKQLENRNYKKKLFGLYKFTYKILFPFISFYKLFKFNQITKKQNNLKLHLGCGEVYLNGYTNIDFPPSRHSIQSNIKKVDVYADFTKLKLINNSIDEIRLHHVFEHFLYPEALTLLAKWNLALKMNRLLTIETPDLKASIDEVFNKGKTFQKTAPTLRHIFGSHEADWAIHKDNWYQEKYEFILPKFGFKIINIENTSYRATRNIIVKAEKITELNKSELRKSIEEILKLYLIDQEAESNLLKVWLNKVNL